MYLEIAYTSIGDPIALTKTTLPAQSLQGAIAAVAIVFLAWMINEARQTTNELLADFYLLTFTVALAFRFPPFLFFRERSIRLLA